MASAVTTDYLSSTLKVMAFDFDPDNTVAVDVSWQDMRDFGAVLMTLFRSVGTGTVVAFKILANSQANGGGTDAEVKVHAIGTAPDAVGDYIHLEALASEIVNLSTATTGDLRYVSASIDMNVSTDECVVIYVFGKPRFAYGSLSADTIA